MFTQRPCFAYLTPLIHSTFTFVKTIDVRIYHTKHTSLETAGCVNSSRVYLCTLLVQGRAIFRDTFSKKLLDYNYLFQIF